MADVTTITRTALRTTPTTFSLHAFERILLHMEYTATLYGNLTGVPENDPVRVERLQERTADSWVETETAALNFLRSHTGRTAVPLLVETVRALVELLDLETGEHPSLQATMDTALVRRAKSAADSGRLAHSLFPFLYLEKISLDPARCWGRRGRLDCLGVVSLSYQRCMIANLIK